MKNPLFALLAASIVAILCAEHLTASPANIKISASLLLIAIMMYCLNLHKKTILFLSIGLSLFTLHQIRLYFPNKCAQKLNGNFIVQELPEIKKNTIRIKTQVQYAAEQISLPDYCLIYVQQNQIDIPSINIGDTIFSDAPVQEIKKDMLSPLQFDYASYLLRRRIAYSLYLNHSACIIKHSTHQNHRWTKPILNYLNNCIHQSIPNSEHAALAASLIIGQRNSLNPETISNYSKVGIIHLLSVSGLHVGIFLWLIHFLFSLFKQTNKYWKYTSILCFLIFYTIITGASIPVIRCAIMFGFIETGKTFRRHSSILNALFASALILLLYNTQFLFDIGFQLSYLALIGIILLQPFLSKKIITLNKFVQAIFDMLSTTLSAWIFTFPAVVFYFHNLSLFGNLINIIAIPMAAVILYLGLLLFLLSSFPLVSFYIGKLINLSIELLNSIVSAATQWPFAYLDHLYWPPSIILFQYTCILLFVYYLYNRLLKSLYLLLCILISINIQLAMPKANSMHIYCEKNAMLLTLHDNRKVFYSVKPLNNQTQKLMSLIQSYYLVDSMHHLKTPYFSFNNQSYLILDQINYQVDTIDYLILQSKFIEPAIKQLNQTYVRKGIICNLKDSPYHKILNFLNHKKIKVKCMNAVKFATIQ